MMAVRYALMAIASAAVATAQSLTDDDFDTFTPTTTRSGSAFWTVTARYAEQATESPYTYADLSVVTDTYTQTRTIKNNVTPTASPYLITTDYDDGYNTDIEVVYAYYTTGVVAESDLVPESTYDWSSTATTTSTTTSKVFSMPVTMTAPASCPTPFTVTTTASVYVPSIVTPQITPASVETDTSTRDYGTIVYQYETWYLSAGAAPFHSTSDYYYEYYIASCSTPPMSRSTGSSSGGGSNYYDDDDSCYSYFCGTPYLTIIIVIASIIPALFLLGFVESWFWFRRLMMGKSAMRFGTVSWVLLSLWVLCFTRMQDRRSAEDQKLLAEKWKNMGSGAAFKAWWKYGFRHRYPEELLGQYCKTTVGIVPPGQPLHPAMAQTPGAVGPAPPGQVYYYGPPPPGWVQGPNGAFIPPQGYVYPPPQQGFNGNIAKDGSVVSHSPVSVMGYPPPQQTGNAAPMPQAPQPAHSAQGVTSPSPVSAPSAPPSPPPQGPLPTAPPQIPSVNVSEAPAEPVAPPPPKPDSNNRDLY